MTDQYKKMASNVQDIRYNVQMGMRMVPTGQ